MIHIIRKNRFSRVVVIKFLFLLTPLVVVAETSSDMVPEFVKNFLEEKGLRKGKVFLSGFEKIEEFSKFYILPQNYKKSASHNLSFEQSVDGGFSHKAWIYKKNKRLKGKNTNHRAYPTIQMEKTSLGIVKSAVLIEISVWPDIELYPVEGKSWFSLATFTSYNDKEWFRSYLVNVDRNYRLHLMHVPNQGELKADIFSNNKLILPRRQWSKVTTFIDYTKNNRFNSPVIAVWQNGILVAASRFNGRADPYTISANNYPKCLDGWNKKNILGAEKRCNLKYENGLAQMHFGLYAPPLLSEGVIYNDALTVSEIIR